MYRQSVGDAGTSTTSTPVVPMVLSLVNMMKGAKGVVLDELADAFGVLSPTYKSRTEDFKKLFKDLPDTERLLVDYSCALQKDILVHGRLYVSQNWICFYANIFRWETTLTIRNKDIQAMTKEKTARVIPNAIQICTPEDKFFFTSFAARDKTYLMLFRVWQNALLEQVRLPRPGKLSTDTCRASLDQVCLPRPAKLSTDTCRAFLDQVSYLSTPVEPSTVPGVPSYSSAHDLAIPLEDTGDKDRQVTYTIGECGHYAEQRADCLHESQVMHRETKPGKRYMLRAEVVSTGFPYSDVFFVINHYCITKVSRKQCRLCVSCEVVYRKQTWGLVKSLIEKNSTQGMVEHFTVLENVNVTLKLLHMCDQLWIDSRTSSQERSPRSASAKDEAGVDHRFFNVTSETFMRAVLCILLLLVVVNVMFFYQLSSLEQRNFAYEYGVGAPPVSFPTTDEEWAVLLQRQRHLHELEIRRWRDVIDLTVKMVDQMQMSLHELKKNFETVSVAPPFDDRTQMP
ncbi:PREDICTED: GRAM domain-containing protein 1B-like [Priapulus caudatus]|uniref:GRAM domain-containing protein 1B-like n=1 Tax=Priapulus caudatus TaxID=37621 RepID=A0ABM1DNM2_PRICU|nr:PREDICTED: GRAM domain-containing protein 1B-like [Priapulus caudatus]